MFIKRFSKNGALFASSWMNKKNGSFSIAKKAYANANIESHSTDHDPTKYRPVISSIINDPSYNKGTAFTEEEREKLHLRGLLPPHVETIEEQEARAYEQFCHIQNPLDKYVFLHVLQGRNETLFYRLLLNHLKETLPIVYTPTVGEACQKFSHVFRVQRGMYFSLSKDKGHIRRMLDNWHHAPDIIVLTDGSRILGLGDLGVNGMGIPIGKLSLYTAGAGFHPARTLPVTIDVGTNNEKNLNDPAYLGSKHPRIRGEKFYEFMEEFLMSVKNKWPNCLVQFEDFSNDVCFELLEQYQNRLLCFNDDIQGTGAVIVAGFINAMKMQQVAAAKQKIVFCGAGSAAVGVADQIAIELASQQNICVDQARKQIYFVDSKGLVRMHRGDTLASHKLKYARNDVEKNLNTLEEVVKEIKPTALIGLSGAGKEFPEPIIREMGKYNERPIIFALSNPTSKSECTAEEAYKFTEGRAIFASGSPFPDYNYEGKTLRPAQGNNMYIFPGLGLGAVIAKSKKVSDTMIVEAAKCLADQTTAQELDDGKLYPDLSQIRTISAKIAKAVARKAFKEGLSGYGEEPNWDDVLKEFVYVPDYIEH